MLRRHAEPGAAGDQHLERRPARLQGGDQRPDRRQDVLGVVEHHEPAHAGECLGEVLDRGDDAGHRQHGRDRRDHVVRRPGAGQPDEPRGQALLPVAPVAELDRQPRLADAGRPEHRDGPARVQRRGDAGELLPATDEPGGRHGQRGGREVHTVEPGVLPQHPALQVLQPGSRCEPQLLEAVPGTVEGRQRGDLPPRPVLGQHEPFPGGLVVRPCGDHRAEVVRRLVGVAELEQCHGGQLLELVPDPFEPGDLRLGEGQTGDVLPGLAAPQRERLLGGSAHAVPVAIAGAAPRPVGRRVEATDVHLVGAHVEAVAAGAGLQDLADGAAQAGHVGLQRVDGGLGGAGPPQPVDQHVAGDLAPRVHQQRTQQPTLGGARRDGRGVVVDPQRSQHLPSPGHVTLPRRRWPRSPRRPPSVDSGVRVPRRRSGGVQPRPVASDRDAPSGGAAGPGDGSDGCTGMTCWGRCVSTVGRTTRPAARRSSACCRCSCSNARARSPATC